MFMVAGRLDAGRVRSGPTYGERELIEAGQLADHVDLGDPPLLDPQPQDAEQSPAWCNDDSRHPIHKRDIGGLSHPGEPPGLVGHSTVAADLGRHPEASIGSANHIGRKQLDQRVQITAACGAEERVDNAVVPGEIDPGDHRCSLNPVPGATGELLARHRGAPDDRRDLIKGYGKQVVEHEGDPLGRREPLQHY
jgi:hypothetical protein